jgi:hypothetical protein
MHKSSKILNDRCMATEQYVVLALERRRAEQWNNNNNNNIL